MIPGMGLVGRHSGLAKSGGGRQQNAALHQRGLILFDIASPQGTSQAAAHPVLELLGGQIREQWHVNSISQYHRSAQICAAETSLILS